MTLPQSIALGAGVMAGLYVIAPIKPNVQAAKTHLCILLIAGLCAFLVAVLGGLS